MEDLKQIKEIEVQADGQKVLDFWFDLQNKLFWFEKNMAFDCEIREKFYQTWIDGCQGLLLSWRETIEGRLAEIIVLDQFSRNLNRENEKAFSQDKMALVLAQEAIKDSAFWSLPVDQKRFILMPMMHSESAAIHQIALPLFEKLGDPLTLEYEIKHKAIIDRFGRYPHRNTMLKRESTPEEIDFLKGPNSSF